MSEINGPKGVGGVRRLGQVDRPEGPRAAEGAAAAAPAEAADPILSLFDRIAEDLAASGVVDRDEAVRSLVDDVLAEQMPALTDDVRASVAADVATSMLSNPDLAARLDRILRAAG